MGSKEMLIIRKEQDEKLAQVQLAAFEARMITHINKHFPSHYEALGEENCRGLIRFGIERGATHGFVSERNVCKYIDLMLCFGAEFDTDEKQSWASEILADDSWSTTDVRMEALFKEGVRRLEK